MALEWLVVIWFARSRLGDRPLPMQNVFYLSLGNYIKFLTGLGHCTLQKWYWTSPLYLWYVAVAFLYIERIFPSGFTMIKGNNLIIILQQWHKTLSQRFNPSTFSSLF